MYVLYIVIMYSVQCEMNLNKLYISQCVTSSSIQKNNININRWSACEINTSFDKSIFLV